MYTKFKVIIRHRHQTKKGIDVKFGYIWLACKNAEEAKDQLWEEWPSEDYDIFDVYRNKVDKFEVQIVPQNFTLTRKQKTLVEGRYENLQSYDIRDLSDDDVEFLSWYDAYQYYKYNNIFFNRIWRKLKKNLNIGNCSDIFLYEEWIQNCMKVWPYDYMGESDEISTED